MRFYEILNDEMERLCCTAKDVCERSGISAATLSRYRSGERLPEPDSPLFEKLCGAFPGIAAEKGVTESSAAVRSRFLQAEDLNTADPQKLLQNFDTLVSALRININRICRHINYDASTVFRFRNGTRKPAQPEKFAASVAEYVARECSTAEDLAALSGLLACDEAALSDRAVLFEKLTGWLLSGKSVQKDAVSGFLSHLNEFDLNEYLASIHFDELKLPTAPFQFPSSRSYSGLAEMMEGELDFLKATVLSRSAKPVILYSDMPMHEMAKDPEFPKKWMFGMGLLLKKGLHLHQIHNLDRSFEEMMLGLESYIPMYMTGQISPYYLKGEQSGVFRHLLKVSGAAALSGEAVAGHHAEGKYYLTKSKKELAYYTARAQALLNSASPLMDIYRSDREENLNAFLFAEAKKEGKRRCILSTLPLYTIDAALLQSILSRYRLTKEERQKIADCAAAERDRVEMILEHSCIEDEIPAFSDRELAEQPLPLDLSGAFCEKDIFYTAEEYSVHLKSTRQFADSHPGYTLKMTASHAFRNLQILIYEGNWAMLSKGKAPAIHFIIRHPKLENAIENFIPPIVETDK